MHMVSKKDLNSAELDGNRDDIEKSDDGYNSQCDVQTHEEATVYVRELDIFLTMKLLEDTRRQFYRWESFAMNMDTHMSGSTVKKHISLKVVLKYSAIRKISYLSWFLVCLQLPQARLPQHPRLLQVRKLIIQITI